MTPTHALHSEFRRSRLFLRMARLVALTVACAAGACVPKTPVATPSAIPLPPVHAETTWEEQLTWIMRLEDGRVLRDPAPPPPVVLRAATPSVPALLSAEAPADLVALLDSREPRVRHRAALAIGRAGLAAGAPPLMTRVLNDDDPEVRQMAAFALGLLADASTRGALLAALTDADPLVQGRAAEALGRIGDKADAGAVSGMVTVYTAGGALAGIAADDLSYPLSPRVEAVRLGLYALVRLGVYDALAAALIDPGGRPVSAWWPVAYAFQRIADPRAIPVLSALAEAEGRYSPAFAIRGLAAAKAVSAAPMLRRYVESARADRAVVVQAMRALALLGDTDAVPLLLAHVTRQNGDAALRTEAMTALVPLFRQDSADLLVELTSDAVPSVRGDALRALARVDPDTFLATLSGLDPDPDWRVRASIATALGTAGAGGVPLLTSLASDADPKVATAAMRALSASKALGTEALLVSRLQAPDFTVRAAAASLLADVKAVSAAPALEAAYRQAQSDETYVARAAALDALRRLNAAAALPVLRESLMDRDWAVRVRAAQWLREQGEVVAPDIIRPASPRVPLSDPAWSAWASPRFSPHAFIETDKGTIELELAVLDAPLTVANFIELARKGRFDGIAFHRVVPDFVVQGGDPRGDGEGGPGYTIRDEINERPYLRGTVGMALDWRDTGGSQFFITHSPQPHLDGGYTVFGHVVTGMEIVDRLAVGDVIRRVRVWDGVTGAP